MTQDDYKEIQVRVSQLGEKLPTETMKEARTFFEAMIVVNAWAQAARGEDYLISPNPDLELPDWAKDPVIIVIPFQEESYGKEEEEGAGAVLR